jgi:hypothetical protein
VLFHQDIAPPHRVALFHQFFNDNNFEFVPRAPYSPHLAPLINFSGFYATQVEESCAALQM